MSTIATITKDGVEIGKLEVVDKGNHCSCRGCMFGHDGECLVDSTVLGSSCGHTGIWQVANG